jgi:ferric-dicitrate binding protein FerR (iron transport regulator)
MVGEVTDSTTVLLPADSARQYTRWASGELIFRRAPAIDVLATLTRWYGYQFRLADPTLANNKLTAVIDAESSVAALGTIKLLLGVDLTFDGNVITLHPRHTRGMPVPGVRDVPHTLTTSHTEVGR